MAAPAIPLLSTDRLLLRGWLQADREPFAGLNADPRVMEFFPGVLDRAASDALADRIGDKWASDGHGLWVVERRADAAFIGFVGLAAPTFEAAFTPCVEIGWRLTPAAWGHGYATEAARVALRYGFVELGLEEIVSFTTGANVRSRAVMERLGMIRDPADDFEHPRLAIDSPLRHHVLYRLRRDAWRAVALSHPEQVGHRI